jgi:plasmid stability protein
MKTTLELPDTLVKQVKLRALRDGKKLKDAMADLLRKGLAAEEGITTKSTTLKRDKKTGLLRIECKHAARPGMEMTPERVAEVLLEQEVNWIHGSGR